VGRNAYTGRPRVILSLLPEAEPRLCDASLVVNHKLMDLAVLPSFRRHIGLIFVMYRLILVISKIVAKP
jgi:hypothetical protein